MYTCWLFVVFSVTMMMVMPQSSSRDAESNHRDFILRHNITSEATKSHTQKALELLHSGKCKHIYLDVGTNVGIQIRKLYEPQYYPKAAIKPIFERNFGNGSDNRKKVCAFGVEPNPHWTKRLSKIEKAYTNAGFPLPEENPLHHEWGASVLNWQKHMSKVTVGALPLTFFIVHEILTRPGIVLGESKIIMKMDIEGAEFALLPQMLTHNALCHIDEMYVEFHAGFPNSDAPPDVAKFVDDINYLLRKSGCRSKIETMDDETYGIGDDLNPLPGEVKMTLLAPSTRAPRMIRLKY